MFQALLMEEDTDLEELFVDLLLVGEEYVRRNSSNMPVKILFLLLLSISLKKCDKERFIDYIFWSDSYKLKWKDFQKKERGDLNFWAYSSVQLLFNYKLNNKNKLKEFEVASVFIKSKSWFSDTSSYILQHEQGHFDIGEIHARMLKKYLQITQSQNSTLNHHVLNLLFKEYTDELTEMQNLYDLETEHSNNYDEQEKWNLKIKALLLELQPYK